MVIIIVEDQSLVRLLLQMAMSKALPLAEIHGAESVAQVLALCRKHTPDLVLLDLVLPDGKGLTLVPKVRELASQCKIIGVSGYLSKYLLHQLLEAKIDGFIDKNSQELAGLGEAIAVVMNGGTYFSPTVRRMQEEMRLDNFSFTKVLSNREMELMTPFGEGLSDAEVSARTGIKASTVRNHRQNIMTKLTDLQKQRQRSALLDRHLRHHAGLHDLCQRDGRAAAGQSRRHRDDHQAGGRNGRRYPLDLHRHAGPGRERHGLFYGESAAVNRAKQPLARRRW